MKYVFMLLLALVVAGAMTFILWKFLRRLKRIEEELWGKKE